MSREIARATVLVTSAAPLTELDTDRPVDHGRVAGPVAGEAGCDTEIGPAAGGTGGPAPSPRPADPEGGAA